MRLSVSGRCSSAVSLVAVAAAVLAAGCGASTHVPAGSNLRIALNEYRVTPEDVHAPAGTLTFQVHNVGRLTHDLVISLAGTREAATGPIAPGQEAELITSLGKGHYELYSSLLDDQALGAYGTLDVG